MSGTMQPMMKPMLTPQMAAAAKNLAALGSGRDNMLAHINPREAQMLMKMGGKGNMNPRTGLPQFDDGGGGGGDQPVGQPVIPTGGTAPAGFTPSSTPYTDLGGAQADNPFDTALYSSYGGSGPVAAGTAPIDPTLLNWVDSNIQSLSNSYGGGAQDPFLMATAPGVDASYSQFAATPGNPNFTINPQGYADFTPAGEAAYNTYASGAEQSIAANAANNRKGDMQGIELALGLPAATVGAAFGASALGLLGDVGAGAADAGTAAGAAGDVFDLGTAGTSIVPDAALGTAADPFAVGSAVTSDFAGGLGDAFTGATGLADVGGGATLGGSAASSLAALGDNPSLAELAAATPDDLVGEAAPAATDATTAGGDVWDLPAAADQSVSDPLSAGSTALNTGGGSDLATLDTTQFPSGFVEPPDPATGLSPGAVGGTGGATSTGGGFFDKLLATGEKELSDPFKLLGLGASGIGLINSLAKQNPATNPVSDASQLQGLATQTGQEGAALSNYLLTGTLPTGLQAGVDQATKAAIQGIKAKYAANGMGPNSTPEQQDINSYMASVPARVAQIGQQLLQSGQSLTSLSASTLDHLLSSNTALNNQTNAAIANLARALSGGGLAPANQNQATAQQTGNVG